MSLELWIHTHTHTRILTFTCRCVIPRQCCSLTLCYCFYLSPAHSAFRHKVPSEGEGRGGGRPKTAPEGGLEGPPARYRRAAVQRREGGGELLAHWWREDSDRPPWESTFLFTSQQIHSVPQLGFNPSSFINRSIKWSGGTSWWPQTRKSTPRKSALKTQK